jgi:uncharacterized protein
VTADGNAIADGAEAPLPATDRIVALDVLRGFALLGIFIMNIPGFSHSMFAVPAAPQSTLDAVVGELREALFAGKFNLLFGLAFGIGFAIQMARLRAAEAARARGLGVAPRPGRPLQVYRRRLAFLFVVGLVHAMLLWSGDVLLIYAVLGFALLAAQRLSDRALWALIAVCLVLPALAEVARPALFPDDSNALAAFEYERLAASNDLAFGHGSFADAMRETMRVFDWSWRSRIGIFVYASFFVQMATGILIGFVVGRRGWPARPISSPDSERRAAWTALGIAAGGAGIEAIAAHAAIGDVGILVAMLARTIGRAALSACYALAVVRIARDRAVLPGWLRSLRDAGRMPLTNYLLQTLLASFVFYGWGLGRWNTVGPAAETALALVLFVAIQLPLSTLWLRRFGAGPLEALWRRFTYG